MFRDVMVGVDERAGGRDAIALARHLLSSGGTLSVAHVDDPAPFLARGLYLGPDVTTDEATAKLLEHERQAAGLDVRLVRTSAPSPGEGLHRLAEEHGTDLLVVGSCSRGRLGRAMLGNDTRDCLNGAPCALAVAPAGYAGAPPRSTTIGVSYDGSAESEAAPVAARDLAARTGGAIHLCEVVALPPFVYSTAFAAGWDGDLGLVVAAAQARLDAIDGVDGTAVYGVTGEELARFGRDLDILIVGSRGCGPARRLIAGSTSNYLLGHARCPLLVLPRAAAAATSATDDAAQPAMRLVPA